MVCLDKKVDTTRDSSGCCAHGNAAAQEFKPRPQGQIDYTCRLLAVGTFPKPTYTGALTIGWPSL